MTQLGAELPISKTTQSPHPFPSGTSTISLRSISIFPLWLTLDIKLYQGLRKSWECILTERDALWLFFLAVKVRYVLFLTIISSNQYLSGKYIFALWWEPINDTLYGFQSLKRKRLSRALMPYACNPSSLGGWDWVNRGLRPAQAKSLQDPISVEKSWVQWCSDAGSLK
jgi:hypothetical protein